jgi:L-fucose isomerase-like protein
MRTTGDFLQNSMLEVLQEEGIEVVVLSEQATKFGSIETLADARACADLFGAHGDEIDGVMVTLPNFGDERAVANALRFAGLNVR